MGFLSKLLAGSAVELIDATGNAFNKVFTNDEQRMQAQAVLEKLRQHPGELQVELNKLEAQSKSTWVNGWRPYVGWVCGTVLAIHVLPYPGIPEIKEILVVMLGFGVYRTVEKLTGRTR